MTEGSRTLAKQCAASFFAVYFGSYLYFIKNTKKYEKIVICNHVVTFLCYTFKLVVIEK